MMASSLQSHRNNAFNAIVIEMVLVSVMGEFGQSIGCRNGCTKPLMGPQVSYEITKNVSKVYDSSNCFPINTELLYVCKEKEFYQFISMLTRKELFRKCTGNGWRDGLDNLQKSSYYSPNCVKKENHCHSPPAIQNPNIFYEIQGRNFTIDDNYTSAFYSVGTTATYKCKDSKPNAMGINQKIFRCTKHSKTKWGGISEDTIAYTWTEIQPNGKDLVCDLPRKISVNDGDKMTAEPSATTFPFKSLPISNNETQKEHISIRSSDSGEHSSLPRNLIMGICSFLGFVLIAVLFSVLYKNRTRMGQQYKDIANHPTQPEEKNQQDRNFANEEENYQYVNIIPIAVNLDTIYTEVETGATDGYSVPAMTRNVDDDQTTVYAEIHH